MTNLHALYLKLQGFFPRPDPSFHLLYQVVNIKAYYFCVCCKNCFSCGQHFKNMGKVFRKSLPPEKHNFYTYNEFWSVVFLGKCSRNFQCLLMTFPKAKLRLNSSMCPIPNQSQFWAKPGLHHFFAPEVSSLCGATAAALCLPARTKAPASSWEIFRYFTALG